MRISFPLLPSWARWLGVAAVGAVIVYFSLLGVPPSAPPAEGSGLASIWDKQLHFVAYAALALALAYATAASEQPWNRRVPLVFVTAVLFGVLIEVLQAPLPHRDFSYYDMLADAIGAVLALAWFVVETRLAYVPIPRGRR